MKSMRKVKELMLAVDDVLADEAVVDAPWYEALQDAHSDLCLAIAEEVDVDEEESPAV